MLLVKPDLVLELPPGWQRIDTPDDDAPQLMVAAPMHGERRGVLVFTMAVLGPANLSPLERLRQAMLQDWGEPTEVEPFETALGSGVRARPSEVCPFRMMWLLELGPAPPVIVGWDGDLGELEVVESVLGNVGPGNLMLNEEWILRSSLAMFAGEEREESDSIPMANIGRGTGPEPGRGAAVLDSHVLFGGEKEHALLAEYLRHLVQTQEARFIFVTGESRHQYPDGSVVEVGTLYIETASGKRQYVVPIDGSIHPRRLGEVESQAPTGWSAFGDFYHRAPNPEAVAMVQAAADASPE